MVAADDDFTLAVEAVGDALALKLFHLPALLDEARQPAQFGVVQVDQGLTVFRVALGVIRP